MGDTSASEWLEQEFLFCYGTQGFPLKTKLGGYVRVCWEGTCINLAWTKPSLGEMKKTVRPGEYLQLNSSQEESRMYHERFHSLVKQIFT